MILLHFATSVIRPDMFHFETLSVFTLNISSTGALYVQQFWTNTAMFMQLWTFRTFSEVNNKAEKNIECFGKTCSANGDLSAIKKIAIIYGGFFAVISKRNLKKSKNIYIQSLPEIYLKWSSRVPYAFALSPGFPVKLFDCPWQGCRGTTGPAGAVAFCTHNLIGVLWVLQILQKRNTYVNHNKLYCI